MELSQGVNFLIILSYCGTVYYQQGRQTFVATLGTLALNNVAVRNTTHCSKYKLNSPISI